MDSSNHLDIALISIHGLIRGHDLELGRDADTGGQTRYVVELAEALSRQEQVRRVFLITRQVVDKKVSPDYAKLEEPINRKATIVRIPFGPRRYLLKENLWPFMDGFVDQTISYFRRHRLVPDVLHGHYADAGYAASQLGRILGVPVIFTGHSLGRVKRQRLLMKKELSEDALNKRFKLQPRIEAEELALDTSSIVITSTQQEVEEQYKLYDNYQPGRMEVIPPGVDLDRFQPPSAEVQVDPAVRSAVARFLDNPEKPLIFAMARADERKNFENLVHAYGGSRELRESANLLLVMGNRDNIRDLEPGQQRVFEEVLILIDRYDLYGSVAYPKQHGPDQSPSFYRLAAELRGVFVNPAYTEPFGLTLLEAAASGLPVVATNDGGPRDILGNCENGELIDPFDPEDIRKGILRLLSDSARWERCAASGIRQSRVHYSWDTHASRYLRDISDLFSGLRPERAPRPFGKKSRLPYIDRLLISDIDNTLTGDPEGLAELVEMIKGRPETVGFAIATGRNRQKTLEVLDEWGIPYPDILVSAVGTEIFFGKNWEPDRDWGRHIGFGWNHTKIRKTLDDIKGLYPQPEEEQSHFKVSYRYDPEIAPDYAGLKRILRGFGLRAKIIYSLGTFVDVIPIRAGDGVAIRRLGHEWGLPPERMLVAGDSGNDEEMLKGNTLGVVVGNYSPELDRLRGWPRIYFAEAAHARGVLEGIRYYDFLGNIQIPNDQG